MSSPEQNKTALSSQPPAIPLKSPLRPPPYSPLVAAPNQNSPNTYTQTGEGTVNIMAGYDLVYQKVGAGGDADQHNGPHFQNGFVPGFRSGYGEVTADGNAKQHNGAKIDSNPSGSKSGQQNMRSN